MNSYDNDLFYLCSLIEYIARKTYNTKEYVVNKIGKDFLKKIYTLAEVYHSENIEKISDEIINECNIENGNYKIENCKNRVPSYFEIAAIYERLIKQISKSKEEYIDNLIKVLTSWIITKIDNYDSSMYYENPSYIYECYKEGKVL